MIVYHTLLFGFYIGNKYKRNNHLVKEVICMMEAKKVKRVLSIIFAALFTALIVVFPSFSAIIQSQCKCHVYTNTYFDELAQNLTESFTFVQNFTNTSNSSGLFIK